MRQLKAQTPHERFQMDRLQPVAAKRSPLRFWEIEPFFRCPVVGLCLTPSEQRQALKKSGHSIKGKSPYEIHEILVSAGESDNHLSRRIDRLLQRKYGRKTAVLHSLTESEFMGCWQAGLKAGNYDTEFWAAVCRPDLSLSSRKDIFGVIHMNMHTAAEDRARATRRIEQLEGKTDEQGQKIRSLNAERRALEKENQVLRQRIALEENQLKEAREEITRLSSHQGTLEKETRIMELERENQGLNAAVADLAEKLRARDRKLASLEEKTTRISEQLENQQEAERILKKEAKKTLHAFLEMNGCNADCPSFDLCRKRILIVGGISRMAALYRQLIEESGGVFEYHDGYMKGGAKQLENRLKRSDLVLCPVNCNSHAACSMVKNLGKKHNKTVHMLPNSSLSTVSQVIRTGFGENERQVSRA